MVPRYPFVSIDAPEIRADELAEVACELGASGVEVRDEHTLERGPGAGRVLLVASFESADAAARARAELRRLEPTLTVELGEVVGDDWRDRYKEHFRPFALTPSVTVVPPWVDYNARKGELLLWLDPGRAFGTGLHATTALVAEELERMRARFAGRAVLDVGTGSGILALTALLLGAARAHAIDNDPDVIDVARENAERNRLSERVLIDTTPLAMIAERFPLVVANLEARTLSRVSADLAARMEPGGELVLSGVLASERDEVTNLYVELGLEHVHTSERGADNDAWVAIVLRAR
jgi:ribosomal protein L11 methyltransferase